MDYSYPIYDTALFGAAAGVTHTLFAVGEGGDAVHTPDFTNMRGNGFFPAAEKYTVRKISVFAESLLTLADRTNWLLLSFLKVTIANNLVFQAPLAMLVNHSAYSGALSVAVVADNTLIDREGNGYMFDPVLLIGNGQSFKVEVVQGTATAASQRIKCVLDGILTRQSQ